MNINFELDRLVKAVFEKRAPYEIAVVLANELARGNDFEEIRVQLYGSSLPAGRPAIIQQQEEGRSTVHEIVLDMGNQQDPRGAEQNARSLELGLSHKMAQGRSALPVLLGPVPARNSRKLLGSKWKFRRYEAMITLAAIAIDQSKRMSNLAARSNVDDLTGCCKRRFWLEILQQQLATADRYGRTFSVLMLDLDVLKQINDRFGHQTGDDILRLFGQFLCEQLRNSDLPCRYGGDEFTVLLPETDTSSLGRLMQRLTEKWENHVRLSERDGLTLRFSYGHSGYPDDGQTVNQLLSVADARCYRQKRSKRRIEGTDGPPRS